MEQKQKETKILSVHIKRAVARERENEIQAALDLVNVGTREALNRESVLAKYHVPTWARGVRVRPAGPFSIVEATLNRGH